MFTGYSISYMLFGLKEKWRCSMSIVLSIIFIAIGIAFMYVGIRICRDVWFAYEWLLVFTIGLCFIFMAIKQLMEVYV